MMFFTNGDRKRSGYLALLCAFIFVFTFAVNSTTHAQDNPPYIELVRIFDPDFTMPHAAGLAFSPVAYSFLVLADLSADPSGGGTDNLTMISHFEEFMGSVNLPAITNPINMAFDSKENRLLLFDTDSQELIATNADPDGNVDPTTLNYFDAEQYGVQNPLGMAVNPVSGDLFILNGADSRIVRIEPDAQGGFDGAAALADGRISEIDLSGLGLGALQGLAYHPTDGHLYVLDPVQLLLHEISETGQLVATRDMSVLDLEFRDPQGIVFSPSADLTDDPTLMHLFLMDSGLAPLSTAPLGEERLYLPLLLMQGQEDLLSQGNGELSSPAPPPAPAVEEVERDELGPGRIIEFSLTQP